MNKVPGRHRRGGLGMRAAVLGAVVASTATAARACPVCRSETGDAVRDGLFDEDFASNLLAIALPFPIFLGIVAAIHGPPARGGRPGDATRNGSVTRTHSPGEAGSG